MTTILIIEDEMHIRGNIAEVLELEYYDVLFAENGRIGVDLALEYVPDLIVCDVMMPEMDGFEVIQALQRAPETAMIPFIFLTALADRQSMRFAMELGADDYVVKPFMSDELLATIQTRLAKRAAALEMYRQLTADTPEAPPPEQAADDESGQQPLIGVTMRGYQILGGDRPGRGRDGLPGVSGQPGARGRH